MSAKGVALATVLGCCGPRGAAGAGAGAAARDGAAAGCRARGGGAAPPIQKFVCLFVYVCFFLKQLVGVF